MGWFKNWLRNKEIDRLQRELNQATQACSDIYDYFWRNDEWIGWNNINVRSMLSLTQGIKDYIYRIRKAKI